MYYFVRNCNLNFFDRDLKVTVLFHNIKSFDLHLYLLDLIKLSDEISVIAENLEKFKYITTDKFIFLDSYQFLTSSLDKLVSSLRTRGIIQNTIITNLQILKCTTL